MPPLWSFLRYSIKAEVTLLGNVKSRRDNKAWGRGAENKISKTVYQ